MVHGCNDPLQYARQAEAEAMANGFMLPGTGINGNYSIFSNPYVGYMPKAGNAIPYGVPQGTMIAPQGAMGAAPQSIMIAPQSNAQMNDSFVSTTKNGEADDGKISLGKKITSFAKGVISPITNMFSSTGNFIKGAIGIAAGAGLIAITGGAAAPVMVAAGIGLGGIQVAKGAIGAATAKTDAEAEQAWESIGGGTAAVVGSVAGAKAALKASGVNTSGMSTLEATKECFTHGFSKTNLTNAWTRAKTNTANFFKGSGKTGAAKGNMKAENNNKPGKTPEEIIENGRKKIQDGESSNKVQKEARRNLSHDDKKVVQKELQEEKSRVLQEAANAEEMASKDGKAVKDSVGESKTLKQQANKATSEADVTKLEEQINANQAQRQENLTEMQENFLEENKKLGQGSEEFGGLTKKQRQALQRAKNQNAEATINENRALEIARENQVNAAEAEAVKTANQEKWLDGQTEESIAQLEANANKTQAKAAIRKEKALLGDKRTQAKMKELKFASKEKLEKIFDTSTNKYEQAAAYQLLLQA